MDRLAHKPGPPCLGFTLVVVLCMRHAATASPSLSTATSKIPGIWLLTHPNARCNPYQSKDLGSGNIFACEARALADHDCGSEIVSNGLSCQCVRKGETCRVEPGDAFSVYEFRRPWAPRGHVAGEDKLSCLKAYTSGCQKVQQEVGCLSGRDGQSPCVWCGGRPCAKNGSFLCESLDSLGSSEQLANSGMSYHVAACDGDTPRPAKLQLPPSSLTTVPIDAITPSRTNGEGRNSAKADQLLLPQRPEVVGCLQFHVQGCFNILDKDTCVNRRDGQSTSAWNGVKIHGEPCVWCGESCVWACEPFEYFMQGEGKTFASLGALGNLTVANCKDGLSRPATMHELVGPARGSFAPRPWWLPQRPSNDAMRCLTSQSGGCSGIGDVVSCLSSRDGSEAGRGEPCVWCGGKSCSADGAGGGAGGSLCEAYGTVAAEGQGRASSSKAFLRVASCQAHEKVPLPPHSCLHAHPQGCHAISSKETCLNSMDGSGVEIVEGLKVHGQPCVWCGGGACHTNRLSFCEPFDYLINGEGKAFLAFTAKLTSSLAACKGSEPHPAWLASWLAPKWPHLASPRYVQGSECVNFPPCVEIGLKFGSCCPDFAGKVLSCCSRGLAPQGLVLDNLPLPAPPGPGLPAPPGSSHSEASGTSQLPPGGQHPVAAAEHAGEDCWWNCNQQFGYCEWCGPGNACCSSGGPNEPAECAGAAELVTATHECIATASSKEANSGMHAAALPAAGKDATTAAPAAAAAEATPAPAPAEVANRSTGTKYTSHKDRGFAMSDAATTGRPASLSTKSTLHVAEPGKSVEGGTALAIPTQATLGVESLLPRTTESAKSAQQSGGNLNCPWWVGALFLMACMVCLAWFMGLHQPYIESCDVVRQNMPLLKSENRNCSKSGCGVDTDGSDEDEIQATGDHLLRQHRNGSVVSRGLSTTGSSETSLSRQTHGSVAIAPSQEKYDLVTITPGGPKVLSLHGGAVPPGIPVATQPYDLITVPPQEEVPHSSLNDWSGGKPDLSPQRQLSVASRNSLTLGPPSRRPSTDFDVVTITPQGVHVQPVEGDVPAGMPLVRVDNRHPSSPNYRNHIPEGPVVVR